MDAVFNGLASFTSARFFDDTSFGNVEFNGDTVFAQSSFSNDVDFKYARFFRSGSFLDANFRDVSFLSPNLEAGYLPQVSYSAAMPPLQPPF